MKKYTVFITLFLLFQSCEKPTGWKLETYGLPEIVVEGFVTNVAGMSYVKLALPEGDPTALPQPVKNALIAIYGGDDTLLLDEDISFPGIYKPPANFRGVINRSYRLFIRMGDKDFTAAASMRPVTPLDQFSFSEDAAVPGNYLINTPGQGEPSMIRYTVTWKNNSIPGQDEEVIFYQYILSTIDVNQVFKPTAEKLSFPPDARVIREKYSLSPGYEHFIRSLLSETEWKGGWFDVLPGNLTTNLSNGAAGYFAACTVVSDTVYFE